MVLRKGKVFTVQEQEANERIVMVGIQSLKKIEKKIVYILTAIVSEKFFSLSLLLSTPPILK